MGLPAAAASRRKPRSDAPDGLPLNDARWFDSLDTASRRETLLVERRTEALWAWRSRWEALRKQGDGLGIDFDELMRVAQSLRGGFALLCIGSPHEPTTLTAVAVQPAVKLFKLGERRIGDTGVRQAAIVGGHVLGAVDRARLERLFRAVRSLFKPDVFSIREIEIASPTYRAARQLRAPWMVTSPSRVDQLHWTLDLPNTFEAYLEGLSSKTRQSVRYSIRKYQKELKGTIENITRADQVDSFLRDAETISRRTYQWNVGDRLQCDESTRAEYLRRANSGTLRAYLMRIDGQPAAFSRGQLRGGQFYDYETPGYLPEYGKWSIGTVLLMHCIEDLISTRACSVFDFGEGGDEHGYKSRFGNRSTPVRALDVAGFGQWRGQTVMAAQGSLGVAKNAAQRILGESEAKRRIKNWLRR